MGIKLNVREGSRISSRVGARTTMTMVMDVSGLTGTRGSMLWAALNHPRVPRKGERHPSVNNMLAQTIDGELISGDTARLTIGYEESSEAGVIYTNKKENTKDGLIQIGGSITTGPTQLDKDGVPLTVQFISTTGVVSTQGVTVQVARPQSSRRIERTETVPDLSLSDKFTGTVNQFSIWGRPARTLLCRSIQFTSRDGGVTWAGSYEFQYNEDTWDVYMYFKDKDTGDPKVGITRTNGIERRRVLKEEDFA